MLPGDSSIAGNSDSYGSMSRPRQASDAVTATVIGMAAGLFTTVSLLLSIWLLAPFFAPLLLVVLVGSVVAARSAAKRLELPGLQWWQISFVAIVSWPIAATLPYAALIGEVNFRIDVPPLPSDATSVTIRATPLSGGSIDGPAPGIVAEYWTPRSLDAAKSDLVARLPMPVNFHEEYLHAIPSPHEAQAIAKAEGGGTRVKLGVFGDYTSALPWLMFFAGWGWIAITFLTRPPRTR
jgi:hypothetical protein